MSELNNAIIRASAGSGKTYELVRRYLRLLALNESPESIVAMTFTRKSAREFFERILQKLAELAADPASAKDYVDELTQPGVALAQLRRVIHSMDRLRLGTIDSFFASVARCFPFELGLAGQASIMPEDEAKQARDEVMGALMVEITRGRNRQALSEMLEAWKRATAGKELNRPSDYLDKWFNTLHNLYLECSDQRRWGMREVIWPDTSTAAWMAEQDLKQGVEHLRDVLDVSMYCKVGLRKWEEFFQEALERRPGEPLPKNSAFEYMLSDEKREYGLLREGRAIWKINKREPVLDHRTGSALADVLDILMGRELMCRSGRTQGRRDVIARFDHQYEKRVRSRGRLAFADLTWLLVGRIHALNTGHGDEAKEQWVSLRQDWEYRLDSRFHHWLFDEFQDTSRRQWDVLGNLVDEAATDPEGRRSFFAVGDLKQSLYLWRQAEPELFLEIEARYQHTRMADCAPLITSFRTCPSVLAMVNDVFSKSDVLKNAYPDAMRWWTFENHRASEKTKSLTGHAALLAMPKEVDAESKGSNDACVMALIRNIAPLDRGLTCAVLTRSNDEAQRLSTELRRALNIEVVCESEVEVSLDNPISLVLLSVLKLAVHPHDRYASWHVRMSPLSWWFEEYQTSAVGNLGHAVRNQLAKEGFLAVLNTWADHLKRNQSSWDIFSEWRCRQLLDLAAEFDKSGSRDVDAFIESARNTRIRTSEQHKALQVMTIHKAKGLEFDVVIMPSLQSTALDQAPNSTDGESLLIERDEQGSIEWILDKPASVFSEHDATLSSVIRKDKARLAYQGLCRLYVGMTRAKRALYLIQPNKINTRSEADLLNATLKSDKTVPWEIGELTADCEYESGERDWFANETLPSEVSSTAESEGHSVKLAACLPKDGRALQRLAPSGEEQFVIRGNDLFGERRESQRKQGLLVHRFFAELEWLSSEDEMKRRWESAGLTCEPGYGQAEALVLSCLNAPEILSYFHKTDRIQEVWRERGFDMVLEGQWVSGIFDRVMVERDATGQAISAVILDFKTDAVSDDGAIQARAKGYTPQIKLYVEAVCRLTGLSASKVRTGLIFTARAQIYWL
ncbi:hypothetical protein BH11VER1_BH11VER1_18480 [soil metagenome]